MEAGVAKVSEKGQVTIPQDVREQAGILPGTSLVFFWMGDTMIVKKVDDLEDLFRGIDKAVRELGITPEGVEEALKEARRKTLEKFYGEGAR